MANTENSAAKIVKAGKLHSYSHASYEEAMTARDNFHEALVDAGYTRGYVSMQETPGKDFKPITTHDIEYRDRENDKSCCVVQTFMNNKGEGETTFKPREKDKNSPMAVG